MKVIYRNHNEEFSELQDKYLEKPFGSRDNNILDQMWEVCYSYSCNLLINYTNKRSLIWDDFEIEEKASDMATWLIEPYLRDANKKIERLTAYAHFAKLKILYTEKDYEMKKQSLDAIYEGGGEHYLDVSENDNCKSPEDLYFEREEKLEKINNALKTMQLSKSERDYLLGIKVNLEADL